MTNLTKDYIDEITAATYNYFGDNFKNREECIEAGKKAIQIIQAEIDEAQDKLNARVEYLIDSFGGKDCTIRDLKGENGKL